MLLTSGVAAEENSASLLEAARACDSAVAKKEFDDAVHICGRLRAHTAKLLKGTEAELHATLNLGIALRRLERQTEAIPQLARAVEIAKAIHGPDSKLITPIRFELCAAHLVGQTPAKCEQDILAAARNIGEVSKEDTKFALAILLTYAKHFEENGDKDAFETMMGAIEKLPRSVLEEMMKNGFKWE